MPSQRERSRIIGFLVFVLFLGAIPASGSGLRMKIAGGLTVSGLGSLRQTLQDWSGQRKSEAESTAGWEYLGGNTGDLKQGFHLEGEALLFLTPRIAAGFGAGYIHHELAEEETELIVSKPQGIFHYVLPSTVTAFPITLSGYFFLPVGKNIHVFFRAGGGRLWAKHVLREGSRKSAAVKYGYPRILRSSATGTVLLGGCGVLIPTQAGVSFLVEISVRSAEAQGFSGENKDGERGTLFSFEEYDPKTDRWWTGMDIRSLAPSGAGFRSVKETAVDFSGCSVKIGIMLQF